MKVICPNCKRRDFETTEHFNPDITPNGSMVKCLLPYAIDWLCASTTLVSELNCPECQCNLAPSGRLTVVADDMEKVDAVTEKVLGTTEEQIACAEKVEDQATDVLNSMGTCNGGEKIRTPLKESGVETGVLTEDQKTVIQDAEIQKERLKTEIPQMKVPGGAAIIDTPKAFICDVCGKACASEIGLRSHKRSHK